MQNTTDAVVYSSCFTNGIGAIYFDAVNGWLRTDETDDYKLVVEIATNAVENGQSLSPTDINSMTITESVDEGTGYVTATTNRYGNLEGQWRAVPVIPFVRDGTDEFVRQPKTTELSLDVQNGGTMDYFYRVVVPLDILGPVRFRIRRTSAVSTETFVVDGGGFILLDNIIASVPAMRGDLVPAGHFDASKTGARALGWELSTSVPYPSTSSGEITGFADPVYYVNSGDGSPVETNSFFASATMYYRWRYLNQGISAWKSLDLNPADGFKALAPFELPDHACDVEYWFEYALQAPFYRYVDYSGLDLGVDYTEERGTLTNKCAVSSLPSGGGDWFFRVRDGQSDYAGIDIVVRRAGAASPERVPMVLAGDHSWRGYVQTREDQAGPITYRLEALDRQTESYARYAPSTNYWYCATENPAFPVSDKLESDGTAESWSTMTLDAVTGHVMFQIDDRSLSLTVVHADYQDFNGWSDALNRKGTSGDAKDKLIFVGTSATNAYKVGVSPSKQTFEEDFSGWGTMAATNSFWQVPTFRDIQRDHLLGRTAYETFASDTNGLWSIGQGMYVAKKFRNDKADTGVAIQMEGNGRGYLQFIDQAAAPRGLESISFNARLGQFILFDDFSYYYGSVISKMQGHVFLTRAAFDLAGNTGFAGNASLSLVAHYLPTKGCYEARWEWIGTELDKNVNNNKGQRLALYKWTINANGASSELISAWTNTIVAPPAVTALENNATQYFMPYFITATNDVATGATWVMAGVRLDSDNSAHGGGIQLGSNWNNYMTKWYGIRYRDNTSTRLTRGTYGVLSANCNGVFARPQVSEVPIPQAVDTTAVGTPGTAKVFTNLELKLPNADIKNCASDFSPRSTAGEEIDWSIKPGRMGVVYTSGDVNALVAETVAQRLELYIGSAGRTDWGATPYKTIDIDGFGAQTFTNYLYTTKDCSVRFAVAGTVNDVRTDIVIDSVQLRQWRGGDWNDDNPVNGVSALLPAWASADYRTSPSAYSNFVFTSCWVTNGTLLMSAKRTDISTPGSLRSPLMDGWVRNGSGEDGSRRGIGLGMVSIGYANAQENARLVLQIATNDVDYARINGYDASLSDVYWTDVTNYNFAAMTAAERKSGVLNTYIGLHSVTGAVRLVVDTNTIAAVASETNPARFGDVTITSIVCRDEPPVDVHSWWGWNMRTVGGDLDGERRMLLHDYGSATGAAGLSAALNNSVDADYATSMIEVDDRESYRPHKPFIQTPTFSTNVVGEIAFKARKYSTADPDATVVLFGSKDASETDDGTWEKLAGAVFTVTNAYYETYSYKTDPGQTYKAFRLAIAGVHGVNEDAKTGGGNALPDGAYDPPPRVLVDEMAVSEAVRARMGFKNVGCFKSDMSGTGEVSNVPSREEQPMCEEAWGVQCEIYGAQLPDDIDFARTPRVFLHWFDNRTASSMSVVGGESPWGFERWRDLPGHRSAQLTHATGMAGTGRYVYRSSQRTSPDAVIGMSQSAYTCVQFTLEVVYNTKGSSVETTNWLSQADWTKPEWYRQIDWNADANHGGGKTFAAYNILDNVAPGWAWINEVNLFGEYDSALDNSDEDYQYIEIAQPPEADLSGWSLRFLEWQEGNGLVVTNTLATFNQRELSGTKAAAYIDPEANMVFRVIANRQARTSGRLKYEDGTLDAVWMKENPDILDISGAPGGDSEISPTKAVGLQLVRESGIVEHEIVVMGTNWWTDLPFYEKAYGPASRVAALNSHMAGADFFYLGVEDDYNKTNSLGVFTGNGAMSNEWNNTMGWTPGRRNANQYINPDHPKPNGESVLMYLTVAGDHIEQSLGGDFTNGMFLVTVPKASLSGTNVTYRLDRWYVLGSATTNGVALPVPSTPVNSTMPWQFVLEGVGKGLSNNVTLVARAAPDARLASEFDVGENNPYRPAIIDWLGKGKDLYGNDFADMDSGEIRLAEFRTLNNTFVTNMTLTEMYWLDMDPTAGRLALIGGMKEPALPRETTGWDGSTTVTNVRMGVHLMITNENETAAVPAVPRGPNDRGTHWTPYALRGLASGSSSLDYTGAAGDWPSETFKITARLLNGYTKPENSENWAPLRLFVFHPDSFTPEGLSRVEIDDPHSFKPFVDWWAEYGPCGIGYYWSLDEKKRTLGVEVLKQENYYEP